MTEKENRLPSSQRDDEHVQGHWLLARLGKRVLRPGGVELTRTLLARADIAGADVLELAPGLGRTAAEIVARNPKSYVGAEGDPDAASHVRGVLGGKGKSGSPTPPKPDCPTPVPTWSSARQC